MTWMLFDWLGTVAFAVSGAMVGLSRRMDIFGIIVLAVRCISSGSSTIRTRGTRPFVASATSKTE